MNISYWKCTTMFAVMVTILSQFLSCVDGTKVSFQKTWYVIFQMLLVKKKFMESLKRSMVHEKTFLPSLELKRKRKIVKRHRGDSKGQAQENCLIPGLHDDIALYILARTSRSEHPRLACVNKRFRELIDKGYLYNLRKQLGIIEYWLYLRCSDHHWEAFDLVRQRWVRLLNIPSSYRDTLVVGTELFIFTPDGLGSAVSVYKLLTPDFSRIQLVGFSRRMFASGSEGKIAIVAGGLSMNGQVLKSADLYNSETHGWETLPDMNCPRYSSSGFFMDGRFYVIGGKSSDGEYLACGEEYNFETRTWRRIRGIDSGTAESSNLYAVVNNQLFSADLSVSEVKKYDKINNSWVTVGRLPGFENSLWCTLAFKSCGDRLLVISGHRAVQLKFTVLYSWRPQDGNGGIPEWHVLSRKRVTHQFGVAGLLDEAYFWTS